jgi:hypothetical protein
MKKIKDYESSLMYKFVMSQIEDGKIDSAFSYLIPKPPTKKDTKTFSLIEILKDAYGQGNQTEEFIETLKGAVRMYFQEMCDEGLIHQTGKKRIAQIKKSS